MKNKYEYIITVETDLDLTDEQLGENMLNFMYRLEGYTTEYPKHLKGAELSIRFNQESK